MKALRVTQEESIRGQAAPRKLVSIGVAFGILRNLRGGHLGRSTTDHRQGNTLKHDVLDQTAVDARDHGSLAEIVATRDILDQDTLEFPDLGRRHARHDAPTTADAQEDGAIGALNGAMLDHDVFHITPIHGGQRDAGAGLLAAQADQMIRDAPQAKIPCINAPEVALGIRANLEGIAGRKKCTVLNQHIFSGTQTRALEAQGIILGIDEAVTNNDPTAAIDVEAVVVVIGVVDDLHALKNEVFAVEVVLHPTGRIPEGDVLNHHLARVEDTNAKRPPWCRGNRLLSRKMLLGTTEIDFPRATDANAFHPLGEDQGLIGAHVGIHHRPTLRDVIRIIPQIETSEEAGSLGDFEHDPGFEDDGSRDVITIRKGHDAATSPRAGINSRLDGLRVDRHAVGHGLVDFHREGARWYRPRRERGAEAIRHPTGLLVEMGFPRVFNGFDSALPTQDEQEYQGKKRWGRHAHIG